MGGTIKIATTPWSSGAGWEVNTLCAQAEKAEAMGFHSFWLPENHFGDQRSIPSPLTLLAAVAARTERIKLGTTSYLLPIRHPLLAAEEVAVLDQLSQGRLILGLGRGIQDTVFRAFAIPAADKRKLFRANLDTMCRAWRGEPIAEDESGQPIRLAPLPRQRPHPPLWVAAFGPLALRQVAGLGLPYLASPIESLATLRDNYERYHRAISEAGLEPVRTIPVMRTVFISQNETLAGQVRSALARSVPAAMRHKAAGVEDWAIVGDPCYARDKIHQYRDCLDISHLVVRAGIPGVDEAAQLRSHQYLLALAGR